MTTKPTDNELVSFATEEEFLLFCDEDDFVQIARAVLAKWGTPAPVGMEPYGWHYWNIAGTSVFHLGRSSKLDADIDASREHPEAHHVVPLYTTPQPTQAADSVPEDAALPMQPICVASDGVVRFKKNRMVNDMYEFSQPRGFGLNEMARGDYTQEERMQFAQLIGYSVSGYGSLSYASSESVEKADAIADLLIAARKQGENHD